MIRGGVGKRPNGWEGASPGRAEGQVFWAGAQPEQRPHRQELGVEGKPGDPCGWQGLGVSDRWWGQVSEAVGSVGLVPSWWHGGVFGRDSKQEGESNGFETF